jgi:hypothetical protein
MEPSVERECACAIYRQHHGDGYEREDVVINSKALMDSHGNKGDKQFRKCGDDAEPRGETEGRDVCAEVVQSGVGTHLLVAVNRHGESERETENGCAPGLEPIEKMWHERDCRGY